MSQPERPTVTQHDNGDVAVSGAGYNWTWTAESDRFALADSRGRVVLAGAAGAAVVVANGDGPHTIVAPASSGAETSEGVVPSVTLTAVDAATTLQLSRTWAFHTDHIVLGPVHLESSATWDVVELMLFGTAGAGRAEPALEATWVVHPSPTESSGVGPVLADWAQLDMRLWVGRGSHTKGDVGQQWALPAHFVGAVSVDGNIQLTGALTDRRSDAACIGLAQMPAADHLFQMRERTFSPVFQFRSDLWHHVRTGTESVPLGTEHILTIGGDYRDALRAYYDVAVRRGDAVRPEPSPSKRDTMRRAAWNTWGAQTAAGPEAVRMDQERLESIYDDLRQSGIRSQMFVIDDKWEGRYGELKHDPVRLPNFEEFIDRVRSDGLKVGMWAAFMRCDDPSAVGLTPQDMLTGPDGHAIVRRGWHDPYYLFDASKPRTQEVLRSLVRRFAERYRPDFVKFDFGYELPSLAETVPHDPTWAGELLLRRSLEVVVEELRTVLPDVVVMYYQLSPLMNDLVDLVCPDDLFGCIGETAASANRRVFLTSPLVELGVGYYSSSGYDAESLQQVWFDAALLGSVGGLVGFRGDVMGARPTIEDAARHNGLAQLTRDAGPCEIEPLNAQLMGGGGAARAASWLRREKGEIVGLALRAIGLDGQVLNTHIEEVGHGTGQVVVMSRTDRRLATTPTLGIVPFEETSLSLVREVNGPLTVTTHLHDGSRRSRQTVVSDHRLQLDLATVVDGVPVEWVEVHETDTH